MSDSAWADEVVRRYRRRRYKVQQRQAAMAGLRAAGRSSSLVPERGEMPITVGVGVVGAIIGVADGMGIWAIPYAVVLLVVWLLLRVTLITLMRG